MPTTASANASTNSSLAASIQCKSSMMTIVVSPEPDRGSVLNKIEQLRLSRFRVELDRRLAVGRQDPETPTARTIVARELIRADNRSRTRCRANISCFFGANAKIVAQQLQHRLKRRCLAVSQDTRLKDANALSTATFGKLKAETALADASLTDDADYATVALHCIFEFSRQGGKLVISAGEGAQPSPASKHAA